MRAKHFIVLIVVYEVNLRKGDNGLFGFTHTDGLIINVTKGSSADREGVNLGDLIFAVNDKESSEKQNIYNLIQNRDSGDSVNLKLYRKGKMLAYITYIRR